MFTHLFAFKVSETNLSICGFLIIDPILILKIYFNKHSLVLKMSSTRFSLAIFCIPSRLQDVFKASWKTKNCYAEDVLNTCLEDMS